jgi:hypothetical protein
MFFQSSRSKNRWSFAIRISGVIVVSNVIGAALLIVEEKKISRSGASGRRQSTE